MHGSDNPVPTISGTVCSQVKIYLLHASRRKLTFIFIFLGGGENNDIGTCMPIPSVSLWNTAVVGNILWSCSHSFAGDMDGAGRLLLFSYF